jgi:hypothetical protein
VLRGWSGPALLESYEPERRPIALHNVGRAAEAGGARRTTDEALPWDLDDRLTTPGSSGKVAPDAPAIPGVAWPSSQP